MKGFPCASFFAGWWYYSIFLLIISDLNLHAQSPNDHMRYATLLTDSALFTQTHHNTVELACVNELLTGKCVDYHNDQWFYFIPKTAKPLYINVNYQSCKDGRGIQVIVLSGSLCQPETYEILDCVSLENTVDFNFPLRQIEPGKQYWVNVDGYLKDFCQFQIWLSDQAFGEWGNSNLTTEATVHRVNQNLVLHWQFPDTMAFQISHFIISSHRSPGKGKLHKEVPVKINAYGEIEKFYKEHLKDDSLRVLYLHAGLIDGGTALLGKFPVPSKIKAKEVQKKCLQIPLKSKGFSHYQLFFYDFNSGKILQQEDLKIEKDMNYYWCYEPVVYQRDGVKRIRVEITDNVTGKKKTKLYYLD